MIIQISDCTFREIFNNEKLNLPIRWNGDDYYAYLDKVLYHYNFMLEIKQYIPDINRISNKIKKVCSLLKKSVTLYLDGMPTKAYTNFKSLMNILMEMPLTVYRNNIRELFEGCDGTMNLFRVTFVKDNARYDRKKIFHTPYNARSEVADYRYSIDGYPCLYLSTDLELCYEEAKSNRHKQYALAARFKLDRNIEHRNTNINIIDLAIKPQDFFYAEVQGEDKNHKFDNEILSRHEVKSAYLLWYPVIAACSFIRAKEDEPFAAEYIVPRLIMQWARIEMEKFKDIYNTLIGVRYFSCISEKASDMGFNYVFPVSGKHIFDKYPFCSVLMRTFSMTKPYYLNEYDNLTDCESSMIADRDLKYVDE